MSECCCGTSKMSLVFSCSGSADVGELADRVGRRMKKDGSGQLVCLALLAAGSQGLIDGARSADKVLVLDGCPQDCARKCLEKAGIEEITHLRVTDLGLEKGKSPADEENFTLVLQEAKRRLSTSPADEMSEAETSMSCGCGGHC